MLYVPRRALVFPPSPSWIQAQSKGLSIESPNPSGVIWALPLMALLSGVTDLMPNPSKMALVLFYHCKPVGCCFTERCAAYTHPAGHACVFGPLLKGDTRQESISFRKYANVRCEVRTKTCSCAPTAMSTFFFHAC